MLLLAAAFFGCLLILLSVPVDIMFYVQRHDSFQGRIIIGWMFGIIPLPLLHPRKKRFSGFRSQKKRQTVKRSLRKERRVIEMLKSKGFWQRLLRFLEDLYRSICFHMLSLSARLGLEDPSDTGRLWAFIGPVAGMLVGSRIANVNIEPDFTAASFYTNGLEAALAE